MRTEVAGASVTLDLVGGDVWGLTKRVTGSCRCSLASPVIHVLANGSALLAERRNGAFRVVVPLAEGANEVVAECRGCARGRCRTQPIVLHRRLRRLRPVRLPRAARAAVTPEHGDGTPPWIEQAVVYGVVPHNFGPDGLRSVTARLDSLQDLGITALWLAPITQTIWPNSHGYAVTDYFRVRRDYGTKEDLRELVQEAHARGIRVLMDFIPNHSSQQHRYLKHAQKHGKASPYYEYFDRRSDGSCTHYFHWTHLPNLNFDHPEVRQWMTEAASYWVRECDIDGFRIDAAWGIQQRRPDFWPRWRREMRRLKPDVMLLAEASARDAYWFEHGFDAAYDWTEALGQWAWHDVFEDPDQIVTRLHAALTNRGKGYHRDARVFRFLNNNDTGKRFLTRYTVATERVAAALLLTLPGIPCIYTGQECGAEFEPYRRSKPISWRNRHGLRSYYKQLIALRQDTPALYSPRWFPVTTRSSRQVYGYVRGGGDTAPVLVLLNFSPARARVEIPLNRELRPFAEAEQLTDLLSGERFRAARRGNTLRVSLGPQSAHVVSG